MDGGAGSSEVVVVWYGMVYVNLYSAIVANVSNVVVLVVVLMGLKWWW